MKQITAATCGLNTHTFVNMYVNWLPQLFLLMLRIQTQVLLFIEQNTWLPEPSPQSHLPLFTFLNCFKLLLEANCCLFSNLRGGKNNEEQFYFWNWHSSKVIFQSRVWYIHHIPSTHQVEVGRLPQVMDQPRLHCETLSQKIKNKNQK